MGRLTTHVLDVSRGRPAAGIAVSVERREGGAWLPAGSSMTDDDGRAADLLATDTQLGAGEYRLTFDTGAYFASSQTRAFYPHVSIAFEVTAPEEHHHVPLLLSPFGYSTYRGS